jgi:hypothetical protein
MRGLTQHATFDFDSNPAYVNYRENCPAELELTPAPVRAALQDYLSGGMTAADLRDWAIFIVLGGAYRSPEPPSDDEDCFDAMWDARHELAAPEIHGRITPEQVRAKLRALDRYAQESEPGAVLPPLAADGPACGSTADVASASAWPLWRRLIVRVRAGARS